MPLLRELYDWLPRRRACTGLAAASEFVERPFSMGQTINDVHTTEAMLSWLAEVWAPAVFQAGGRCQAERWEFRGGGEKNIGVELHSHRGFRVPFIDIRLLSSYTHPLAKQRSLFILLVRLS